jgi:glycosyltransferase involved in cell wall biosynthesis
LRILLLSEFYPPTLGGLELYVQALAAGLTARGHEVAVGTLTDTEALGSGSDVERFRLRSLAARVPLASDPSRPFLPPTPDPLLRRDLAAVLRTFAPTIVHSHNWIASSLPRRHVGPLVHTAHDYALVCAKRDLLLADETTCSGPSHRCFGCSSSAYGYLKGPAVTAATVLGRRYVRADRYIAISEAVARSLRPHIRGPIEVVPTSVPDELATMAVPVSGLPQGEFVMYAGAPDRHKGVEHLLRAWEDGLVDAPLLLALTRPYKGDLPPNVHAMSLSRGEALYAWSKAAVAVVPSIWPEPFGTVAVEALAMGTPVVAADAGALREIVTEAVTGYLVPRGDAESLANRVNLLLAEPSMRHRMGDAGRRSAVGYEMSQILPRIEAVYRSALA